MMFKKSLWPIVKCGPWTHCQPQRKERKKKRRQQDNSKGLFHTQHIKPFMLFQLNLKALTHHRRQIPLFVVHLTEALAYKASDIIKAWGNKKRNVYYIMSHITERINYAS